MSTSEKSLFRLSALTVACALACTTITAQAQEAEAVHELDKVTVDEQVETAGKTVLKAAELEMQPNGTGTITDALRGQSFIQFDNNSRSNANAAEITPPQISIRGGRNWENNFTINGLSNNNMMNPTGWESKDIQPNTIPTADAQAIMLSTDLLDNIKVLTENVSAEYGEFTGGVIDARIRDARTDRWHAKLWTRHTRDAWTQEHLTDSQKTEEGAIRGYVQNEFKRTNVGVTLDGPLADGKLGALISYEKAHSNVPSYTRYQYGLEKHHGERDQDTFLIRLNTNEQDDFYVAGTLIYSPYEASGHANDYKDSPYTQSGGGWNFTLNTRANLDIGTWTNDFGFSTTETDRDNASNVHKVWLHDETSYPNWGYNGRFGFYMAKEGAFGDFNTQQDQYTAKSILALNPIKTGNFNHRVRLGAETLFTHVESHHDECWAWAKAKKDPTVHGSFEDGVIDGKQYMRMKSHNPGYDRDADFFTISAFAEDEVTFGRFTVRPGVRLSYDDLTEDVNVAPRFFANIDVLNDGRFNVNFGANRYYGSHTLINALTKSQRTDHWEIWRRNNVDGVLEDWKMVQAYNDRPDDLGDITTPYTDELTFGASANIADTIFKLTAVKRDYQDQIRREFRGRYEQGTPMSFLTNKGETNYKGVTLAMGKAFDLNQFGRHNTELGVTWSRTKSNTFSWADAWNDDPTVNWGMIIDGVRYEEAEELNDLDSPNANAEWVVTLSHNATFMDDRLRANALLRWESGSERYTRGDDIVIGDTEYVNYYKLSQGHMFNADLMLAYDLVKTAKTTVTVNVEALNLFNNKSLVNTTTGLVGEDDHYNTGRQFFLGLTCQY